MRDSDRRATSGMEISQLKTGREIEMSTPIQFSPIPRHFSASRSTTLPAAELGLACVRGSALLFVLQQPLFSAGEQHAGTSAGWQQQHFGLAGASSRPFLLASSSTYFGGTTPC